MTLAFHPIDPVEQDPDPRVAASCSGKERFASAALAHRVVGRMTASKRRRGTLDRPVMAYRCSACGCWHIGGFGGK